MKPFAGHLVLLVLAFGLAVADQRAARCYPKSACRAECEATKQEIRKIQAKMRQGYSTSRGQEMETRLRELRRLHSKLCR
jgi:hypothetical protein